MRSMTGFGRATAPIGNQELSVQISSVNKRALEIAVALPDEWRELETEITERIRTVALRGRITVRIEIGTASSQTVADEASVARTLDELAALAKKRGIGFAPTPELLWQISNSLRAQTRPPAMEEIRSSLLGAVEEAGRAFLQMRIKEGAALQRDMEARAKSIAEHIEVIATRAPLVPGAQREAFLQRLRQANLDLSLNDERVLKELALFADRADITEEITRARSHLVQLGELLRAEGEIGRKTEFLLQEIGREVNTTGSKANDLEIARRVIESKNELERIREQIANVE